MIGRRATFSVRLLLVILFITAPIAVSRAVMAQDGGLGVLSEPESARTDGSAGDKPPLNGGVITDPPSIAIPSETLPEAADPASPTAPGVTTISVWYGATQNFGHKGDPQKWINILGRVTPVKPKSLTYSLNGGPEKLLNVGPDKRRLAEAGDFNIQLAYTELLPGNNQVVITATDSLDVETKFAVTVNYQGGGITWTPGTYVYDWSQATRIDDLAQVVDGQWIIDDGTVRPTVFEFDRLVAIGDLTWRDYTVTVPITFYGIDPGGYGGFSNGPGVGILVRWSGHYFEPANGADPYAGWRRLGALAWYRWQKENNVYTEGLQVVPHTGNPVSEKDRKLDVGKTYIYKLSIQSQANPNLPAEYRFKVWEDGQPEPADWDIVKTGRNGEPTGGGFLLVAHHVDATFGKITVDLQSVRPQPTLTVTTTGTGSGTVSRSTAGPYRYGEDVVLTAVPNTGSAFDGWLGSLTGNSNPGYLEMFTNHSVTAVFNDPNAQTPVSDDFSDCALNPQLWTFVNPLNDATLAMNGSQLEISVPGGVKHDMWTNDRNAPRVMQTALNQDFELDVKLDSAMDSQHQFQGVLVEANSTNFLRFGFQHDGSTYRVAAYSIAGNTPTTHVNQAITISPPMFLRVNRVGDTWLLRYSADGTNWITAATFDFQLAVTATGVFVGNSGQNKPITGIVDYFFNTASPVDPEDPNRTLTVETTGIGSVIKTPAKTNYDCGESVQLEAVPGDGYRFSSWTGDATGTSNPTNIVMDGSRTVTANFVPEETYAVSVTVVGNGEVTKSPDKPSYTDGEQVTLSATPDVGHQFAGWSGGLTGTQNPVIINVDGDLAITATFTPILYTLEVDIEGQGEVTVNPSGTEFAAGTQVQLTAVPANGHQFVRWEGDGQGSNNPIVLTMTGDKTVRAVFAPVVEERFLYLPTVIR